MIGLILEHWTNFLKAAIPNTVPLFFKCQSNIKFKQYIFVSNLPFLLQFIIIMMTLSKTEWKKNPTVSIDVECHVNFWVQPWDVWSFSLFNSLHAEYTKQSNLSKSLQKNSPLIWFYFLSCYVIIIIPFNIFTIL